MNDAFLAVLAAAAAASWSTPTPTPDPQAAYREVGASVSGASEVRAPAARQSPLDFDSSDAALVAAFRWAKNQSLSFTFDDDPVGPWYEAAEPGREAFCMRDTAHQAMG